MAGYARPRRPSIGSSAKELERVVTGEKYCFVTVTPATVTACSVSIANAGHESRCLPESVYTGPETVEPSPYSMEKEPLFFVPVDEEDAVYFFFDEQVELLQEDEGIQRSEEPVSKSIKNF